MAGIRGFLLLALLLANPVTGSVANAGTCAGFHYRFSTIAGREMGQKIGIYVVKSVMQPVQAAMTQ
jgi:hypothetical protein